MYAMDELCDRVKDMQRTDQVGKESWIAYCAEHGEAKRDPKAHDEEFILSFFDAYRDGVINVTDSEPFRSTNNQLFIGSLAEDTTEDMVRSYFESWLDVKAIHFKGDRKFCFVTFKDSEQANSVMETFDQHEINGKVVECKRAEDRRPKGKNDRKGRRDDKGRGCSNGHGKGGGKSFRYKGAASVSADDDDYYYSKSKSKGKGTGPRTGTGMGKVKGKGKGKGKGKRPTPY